MRKRFSDDCDDPKTIIGPEISFKGEISGSDSVDVKGRLEGNCNIAGLLRVWPEGTVTGKVTAQHVIVEGIMRGDIKVTGKAELRTACRMEGDIEAPSVAIAEGGFFEGQVTMLGGGGETPEVVTFAERRAGKTRQEAKDRRNCG